MPDVVVADPPAEPPAVPAPRSRPPARRVAARLVRSAVNRTPSGDRPPIRRLVGKEFRRRGWMGRGLLGAVHETPPYWLKLNERRRFTVRWTLWWFLSGAELDGKRRTNATYLRFATHYYAWSDRFPSGWVTWPRLLRTAVRFGGLYVGWHAWQLYRGHPGPVGWTVTVALGVGAFWVGWRGGDSVLLWPHRRRWVWPLHRALVARFGYHPRTPLRLYLWVPRDYQQRGVWLALPPDWTSVDEEADQGEGEDKADALVAVVRTKLAMGETQTAWRLSSDKHELVVWRRRDLVPGAVMFSDQWVRDLVEESPESAKFLGAAERRTPIRVDFDNESPHLLLSMLSGEGKSVLLRGLGAQVLHDGGEVTILDFKRRSQKWAKGVAGVRYCRDIHAMHLALVDLAMMGDERNREADDWEDSEAEPVHPRHLLIVEEANATIYKLQLWWDLNRRRLRDEDADLGRYCGIDPDHGGAMFGDWSRVKSPAVLALGDILFMGRQSFIHVAAVGQYTTAQAMGGPEIREQFGARGIKGPRKAFAMLAGELDTMPTSRGHRGRIHLVFRGRAVELQVMMMTVPEARGWATSGPRPYGPHPYGRHARRDARMHGRAGVVDQGDLVHSDARESVEVEPPPEAREDLVTLRGASSDKGAGVVGRTWASLRNHSAKDPEFPQPKVRGQRRGEAHWYDRAELGAWHRNREDHHGGD